jgi:putative hydrolase of the HAD superfamily
MIQVVLFDLDQTLLDRTSSLKAFLNWQVNFFELVAIQQKPKFIQRFIELDNNGSVWKDQVYAQLIQEFQISSYSTQGLLENYIQDFNKFCRSFSDVDLVIYSLFKANFSLGLISNGKTPFQEDNFKALGLSEYFSSVIVSEAVGLRKPHPEIFQLACQQLGVIPQHCVFVGDHEISRHSRCKSFGHENDLI